MNKDRFFEVTHCDRCGKPIGDARTMSWFTTETICMPCADDEDKLKTTMDMLGIPVVEGGGLPQIPEGPTLMIVKC